MRLPAGCFDFWLSAAVAVSAIGCNSRGDAARISDWLAIFPAWIIVYDISYEVRINQGDPSRLCYVGAHENGHWSYWPLCHFLPNDIKKAEARTAPGFPVPIWGAETVIEICRQLVRDRVFEVVRVF